MDDQQGQNQEWIPSQISNEQLNQQPPYYQPSTRQFQQPFYPQQTQYNQRQFQSPPYTYPHYPPQRKQNRLSRWYYKQPRKRKIGFWCGIIVAALMFYSCAGSTCAMSIYLASTPAPTATPGDTGLVVDSPTPTPIQPTPIPPTPTPQPPTPTPQPPTPTLTLQQVVQNSGKYDCCLADSTANVSDLEVTKTSDGTVMVLAKVVNLPWPANAVDVGKVLIFQYMASIWTSQYHPQSVDVTILYQGSPSGAMRATMTQDTANAIDWSNANPFDCWDVYDSADISPSLT